MKPGESFYIACNSLKRSGPAGIINIPLAMIDILSEPVRALSSPVMIQIEPTTFCNLRCVMCVNPISKRAKRHMTLAEFKRIVDSTPFTQKISLVGAGEPLMNPDLFDMVSYAKSKGVSIGFATNGLLLDEKAAKRVMESGADWINISVDSADEKRYESIRPGARFDTLIENIKNFMKIKGCRNKPDVMIWFVVMNDNLDDLAGVIELADRLGMREVSCQLEHSWFNDSIKKGAPKPDSKAFLKRLKETLNKAHALAGELGIKFEYVNMPDTESKRACKWPWKSSYVTCEGFVTPCCLHGADPKAINFGNVLEKEFADIWNSVPYMKFRRALKHGPVPAICSGCTAYYSRIKI